MFEWGGENNWIDNVKKTWFNVKKAKIETIDRTQKQKKENPQGRFQHGERNGTTVHIEALEIL